MNVSMLIEKIRGLTLGRILRRFNYFYGRPNQTDPEEIITILRVASSVLPGKSDVKVLEIGSWMGCSTIPLARTTRVFHGKLYCCDLWQGTPVDDLSTIAKFCDVFAIFWKRVGRAGVRDVVVPLHGLSQDVLPILKSKTFDMIYIDGDHRYAGIKHDILQAKRLIRKDGVIAGHDYDLLHPDVMRAVNEIFGKPKHKGRVWWVK